MSRQKLLGVTLALVAVASVPPVQAAVAWAPVAVLAGHVSVDSSSVAIVAWVRGTAEADYYKVYGVDGPSITFLAAEPNFTAAVPAGYSAYAVSGVLGGIESEPIHALIVPCVYVNPTPPPPAFAVMECVSGVGIDNEI